MSYVAGSGTNRDRVRLRLADTREPEFFTDAEIDDALSEFGTVDRATAHLARVALMHIGRFAKSYATDGDQVDETAAAAFLQDLIDRYGGATLSLPRATVRRLARQPSDPTYTE